MYNLAISKIAGDDTYLERASPLRRTLAGGVKQRDTEKFGRWDVGVEGHIKGKLSVTFRCPYPCGGMDGGGATCIFHAWAPRASPSLPGPQLPGVRARGRVFLPRVVLTNTGGQPALLRDPSPQQPRPPPRYKRARERTPGDSAARPPTAAARGARGQILPPLPPKTSEGVRVGGKSTRERFACRWARVRGLRVPVERGGTRTRDPGG